MAKFLHLVTLPGLGGKVRRLKVGACQDQMLCVQEENVHIYSTGLGSLQHTWYANTGTIVQDLTIADNKRGVVILVNKRDIVLAWLLPRKSNIYHKLSHKMLIEGNCKVIIIPEMKILVLLIRPLIVS